MRVTFYGAAGEVTGAKHLVELGGHRILLDCGMVQAGRRESRERNAQLEFDPATVEAVLISHAHFDHIGLLPLIVKRGFQGKIYASGATRDLAELILLDAAKLQEQEADYLNRHRLPEAVEAEPLYTIDDVPAVMERFERLPYADRENPWTEIIPGIKAKLYDAGHILGSAVIVLEGIEQGQTRRLAYTGDLGRWNRPLLRDPQLVTDPIDLALCESTYGNRRHHPSAEVEQAMIDTIHRAVELNGQILVPAFSLGRTQQLIYTLHWMTDQGRIPRIPIIVDSPLAQRITEAFQKHQRDYDAQTRTDFGQPGEDPLSFSNLRFTHSVEESKALNSEGGPAMIISASGMATGGRVMHHLKRLLPDPNAQVLFTGYQAFHTLGRRLVDGASSVKIFGRPIPVQASVRVINDLSAHADAAQIDEYLSAMQGLKHVCLVHGENDRAAALQSFLQTQHPDWRIVVPELGQTVEA